MFRRMFLVLFSAAIFAGGVVPFNAYAARALGVRLSAGSYAPYEFKADGEKYSAPGTNIFVGISLLPPLVVIPGLDLGIEVDQFTAGSSYTANGTAFAAEISFGVPLANIYYKYASGRAQVRRVLPTGEVVDDSGALTKSRYGFELGLRVVNVFFERGVIVLGNQSDSPTLFGLKFRF